MPNTGALLEMAICDLESSLQFHVIRLTRLSRDFMGSGPDDSQRCALTS
jgi:hypothetical protein